MMRYGWVGAGGGFWVLLGLRAVGEAVSREARDVSHPTLDRRACPAEIRPDDTRGRWGMSKAGRAVVAILIAAAVLWLAAWLDGTVMRDIGQQAAQSFDNTGLGLAYSLGSLAVAGGVLLLGVLAWPTSSWGPSSHSCR